jgi:hypothetical protein
MSGEEPVEEQIRTVAQDPRGVSGPGQQGVVRGEIENWLGSIEAGTHPHAHSSEFNLLNQITRVGSNRAWAVCGQSVRRP